MTPLIEFVEDKDIGIFKTAPNVYRLVGGTIEIRDRNGQETWFVPDDKKLEPRQFVFPYGATVEKRNTGEWTLPKFVFFDTDTDKPYFRLFEKGCPREWLCKAMFEKYHLSEMQAVDISSTEHLGLYGKYTWAEMTKIIIAWGEFRSLVKELDVRG
jgi:hypothetical protein